MTVECAMTDHDGDIKANDVRAWHNLQMQQFTFLRLSPKKNKKLVNRNIKNTNIINRTYTKDNRQQQLKNDKKKEKTIRVT